jgi:glycosyltransferase 2 family protein
MLLIIPLLLAFGSQQKSLSQIYSSLISRHQWPGGGEPVRIYLLNKDGLNLGAATAAVLGERLLDAVFILIMIPFALFIFGGYITNIYFQIGLGTAILIFLIFIGVFGYALKYPIKTKHFLIKIAQKIQKITKRETPQHFLEKISMEVDNFHTSMIFFLTKGKKMFLYAGIITALFWITGWTIPILLLLGLGLEPFILESCAAQILIIIISMMPLTPGSSGVSEGGTAALYSVFIPSSLVGVFVLLFRFVTYHIGLIVGAIFQYRIFKSVASFSIDRITSKKE